MPKKKKKKTAAKARGAGAPSLTEGALNTLKIIATGGAAGVPTASLDGRSTNSLASKHLAAKTAKRTTITKAGRAYLGEK